VHTIEAKGNSNTPFFCFTPLVCALHCKNKITVLANCFVTTLYSLPMLIQRM